MHKVVTQNETGFHDSWELVHGQLIRKLASVPTVTDMSDCVIEEVNLLA